jgi:type I restriction enzyme S subunit
VSEGPWPIVLLGELIASIEAGASFRCRETPPEADEVGVAKVSAVSWGRYDENESKTCLNASRIDPSLLIHKGDFLISRANTVQLVGACVIAEQVTKQVMLSDKTLRIQFTDSSLKPWVLHYLRSREGRNQIEALCTGNQESMRNISQRSIRQIQLPLAPAEERDRVIAYLDQQLSRLQASVEIFGTIQAKLKQARASILKAAVEGRLVETEAEIASQSGRSYESANQQLAQINLELGRKREAINPEDSRRFSPLEGWAGCKLGDIGRWSSGGTPSRKNASYFGGAIPWIKTGELNDSAIKVSEETLTVDGIRNSAAKLFPKGTLLVAMYGATIGMTGILEIEASTNQACAALLPTSGNIESMRYFQLFLQSQRRELRDAGQGGAQPNISQGILKDWILLLPPLAEQYRIVDEVDRRFSVLDQVESTVTASLARCGKLRQAILKRAFGG